MHIVYIPINSMPTTGINWLHNLFSLILVMIWEIVVILLNHYANSLVIGIKKVRQFIKLKWPLSCICGFIHTFWPSCLTMTDITLALRPVSWIWCRSTGIVLIWKQNVFFPSKFNWTGKSWGDCDEQLWSIPIHKWLVPNRSESLME